MKYRIIGSILVVLSGFALFADLIFSYFGIQFKNTYGFNSSENFIFYNGLLISVLLNIVAGRLKPFLLSYLIPLYCIILSFYWIYFLEYSDKEVFNIYVFIISVTTLLIVSIITIKAKKHFEQEKELVLKNTLLEKVLDLSILTLKKDKKESE